MKNTPRPAAAAAAAAQPTDRKAIELPLDALLRDERNRRIDETTEDFLGLVDSIRVLGVLDPLHVQEAGDGTYRIIAGERRWRASGKAGRAVVPCIIWPEASDPRDVIAAALATNEHREAVGCLDVARRLRQLKNEHAETNEQIAARTSLPPERVKQYAALFQASDFLLEFFEHAAVALAVAAEFVRLEKACGETVARRIARQHLQTPYTSRELVALRKRGEGAGRRGDDAEPATRTSSFVPRLAQAFKRDQAAALAELEATLATLGFRVVPIEAPAAAG